MKYLVIFKVFVLISMLVLIGCEQMEADEDVIPARFKEVVLNPDVIYTYLDNETQIGTRLDPLLNDSIKVEVSISYSTPSNGIVQFIPNEGWFYKANTDFIGVDNFNYTVCFEGKCYTSTITMNVEQPLSGAACKYELIGETVETTKDQPIEIRIFINDTVCPYRGTTITSPEKGTFNTYAYSGNIKNVVYVYFPPKGFVGTDKFKYKIFTDGADIEAYCTINIKP